MPLSVIIITKNEAASIRRCIESVAWADEIIVVDSGSTDDTVKICRELGAKVSVTTDWPGFGPQKNRALELATQDWVLSLDADETVSNDLQQEIRQAITSAEFAGWEIPRLSSYCGSFIKHSGWWPDYTARLFRKGTARFSDDLVHEKLLLTGTPGKLQNHLIHYSYANYEQVIQKINAYSTAGAHKLALQGKTSTLSGAVLRGLWAFFRSYVIKRGFLDGRAGFQLAVTGAETTYYKYVKLMHLQKSNISSNTD